MKKYYQTDKMQALINWDEIMEMDRWAGGHDEQMKGLFKNAEVIGHWNEGDYQGMVATCVKLPNGKYAIYNDYYGSCSGCDAWEGASDENVKSMCVDLANGAYIFESIEDVKAFLSDKSDANRDGNYEWLDSYYGVADNLLRAINNGEVE
jgi:hypothetical protein